MQVLLGGADNINAGSFAPIDAWLFGDATEAGFNWAAPVAGTLDKLKVSYQAGIGAGANKDLYVRKNGANSALVTSVAPATLTGEDTTHSVTVAQGDLITMIHDARGTGGGCYWTVNFTPDVSTQAIWSSLQHSNSSAVATQYHAVGANGGAGDNTESAVRLMWGIYATIDTLYVKQTVAPGAGKSRAYRVMLNGVATGSTLTISDAATSGQATGLGIVIAPTDELALQMVPSGTPAASSVNYGIAYVPTTAGQWNITGRSSDVVSASFFSPINSQSRASTEATSTVGGDSGGATTWDLQKLYWKLSAAPGSGKSRSITLRMSAANTALTATIAHPATTAVATATVTVGDEDELCMNFASADTPDTATQYYALQAGPPSPAGGSGGNLLLLGVG